MTFDVFQKKYNLTTTIPAWIVSWLSLSEKLLTRSPETQTQNGIILRVKKILIDTVDTLRFYIMYKDFMTRFWEWYFKTPMIPSLNAYLNSQLLWNAAVMAKFESATESIAEPIQFKLAQAVKESEGSMAGVGQLSIGTGMGIFGACAALVAYFWKKPEIAAIAMRRKIFEYDMETDRVIMKEQAAGKTDEILAAYAAMREKSVNRAMNTLTETVGYADTNFFTKTGRVLQKSAGQFLTNPVTLVMIAAAAAFLFLKKK